MSDNKTFGSYLRSYRKIVGYGLREFARELDTCPSNLSAIELGHRPVPRGFDFPKAMELLGIHKGTSDWELFLSLAAQSGSIEFLRKRVAELEEEIKALREEK
jgi:transcriptional regulator with XRE-family HTH domain